MSEEQREELRRFLQDRRARVSPAEAGIQAGPRRRVRGLRREEVALLAGIGVSWYTALENGDAKNVSEATLLAVADALRLSASERQYLLALTGRLVPTGDSEVPVPMAIETMKAIAFPAYIITVAWEIVACNEAFRRVWGIAANEPPFNAIERLFLAPAARAMHGEHFTANITPVIAMVHSSLGRRHKIETLQRLRDRLLADETVRRIWNEFEIAAPHLPNRCTIESPLGTFSYETLNLPISGALYAIVVQVPDDESRRRL
jgi:transcriptional regulator with XRE-family HTH domain